MNPPSQKCYVVGLFGLLFRSELAGSEDSSLGHGCLGHGFFGFCVCALTARIYVEAR